MVENLNGGGGRLAWSVASLCLVLLQLARPDEVAGFLLPTPRHGVSWWHCSGRGCSPVALCAAWPPSLHPLSCSPSLSLDGYAAWPHPVGVGALNAPPAPGFVGVLARRGRGGQRARCGQAEGVVEAGCGPCARLLKVRSPLNLSKPWGTPGI